MKLVLNSEEAKAVVAAFCAARRVYARTRLSTNRFTIEEIPSDAIIIATNARVTVEVHQNFKEFLEAYNLKCEETENEHF